MKLSVLINLFMSIPDQRQEWKIKHKLIDILFIVVVAVVADCDDWEEIEWFAKLKENWFRRYLELPNGIPSHDTMERVFAWIDPTRFREAFLTWISAVTGKSEQGVFAIDGKTMRATKDGLSPALHVVNAWFSENGLIFGSAFIKGKGGELAAFEELLDILDVSDHIVTIDAAGTYRTITEKIINKNGDFVLALKANQPNLHENVKAFFEDESLVSDPLYAVQTQTSFDKGHGRIESRKYYMTDQIDWLEEKESWVGINSIGMVRTQSENTVTGEVTVNCRYFISSLPCHVGRFAYAVRNHWGVESMHWSLDMTFNEDRRRSRKNDSGKNLASLIRLAYDIIKLGGVPKRTPIKRLRKQALVDDKYLDKLFQGAIK